jgi:DNA-binding response OmpR family regulator
MATFGRIKRLFGTGTIERRAGTRLDDPQGARVLVVDDSTTIRAVLAKMLNQGGHFAITTGDGEEAIALACSELPDLIFLDIVMPGTNGFAVLRALRREPLTHDIPIVMISGNLQATAQFYVQRYGADDFMKKPFGREEVFARIHALSKSGRLVVRPRDGQSVLPEPIDQVADDAIPDIAMPDPHDQ